MTHRTQLPRPLRHLSVAGLFALGLAGCRHNQAQSAANANTDPAAANMAEPYNGGNAGGYGNGAAQVLGQSQSYAGQSSGESYATQTPAPIIRRAPAETYPDPSQNTTYYPVPQAGQSSTSQARYDAQGGYANDPQAYGTDPNGQPYSGPYDEAEQAGEDAVTESDQAPPQLPEYDQPPAPADDYEWTPGYWNYASAGYYWVPGAWVAPPFYGALWTPPYWGYAGDRWHLHRGYWGPHVGYYGGINYGFGYIGIGYFGGYWNNNHFFYNRAVTNVNVVNVHNVYNRTVIYNNVTYGPHSNDRISYNGGRGGINAQPRPQELTAMHETHFAPTAVQAQHREAAAGNRGQFFAENHGRPTQAFAGQPVGNLGNVGAPPRSFLQARAGQPGTTAAPDRFGGAAPAATPPAGNNGFSRNGNGSTQPAQPSFNGGRSAGSPVNAGRLDPRNPVNGTTAQPGNMYRPAPSANAAGSERFNRPATGAAPNSTNPEETPGRNTNRFGGAAQPGTAQPVTRPDANASHLPTPDAPRTQINNGGANGTFNRPQAIQQRPENQQRYGYQQRPDTQQRPPFDQQVQRPQAQQPQLPQRTPAYGQPQAQQRPAYQGGLDNQQRSQFGQQGQRPQAQTQQLPQRAPAYGQPQVQQRPEFQGRPEPQAAQPRVQAQPPQQQFRPEAAPAQRPQATPRMEAPRPAAEPSHNASPHNR